MKVKNTKVTKRKLVEDYLTAGNTITSWEAIRMFHATRLSDIIFKMKKDGWAINSRLITDGENRYTKYWLWER